MRSRLALLILLLAVLCGLATKSRVSVAQDATNEKPQAKPDETPANTPAIKAYSILRNACWECHGQPDRKAYGKDKPFEDLLDYSELLKRKLVVPGDDAKSGLIKLIRDKEMPRAFDDAGTPGKHAEFDEAELKALSDWVKANATEWPDYSKFEKQFEWEFINKKEPDHSLPQWRAVTRGPDDTLVAIRGSSWSEKREFHIWKNGTWTRSDAKGFPENPSRVAIWNPVDQTSMFFTTGSKGQIALDVWDGSKWKHVEAEGAPPMRSGFCATWNPATSTLLLFGGAQPLTESEKAENSFMTHRAVNELWEFDGSAWTRRDYENAPPPAKAYSMAYDRASKQVFVVQRGYPVVSWTNVEETPDNVTCWALGKEKKWKQLNPVWSPPSRFVYRIAWWDSLGCLVAGGWYRTSENSHADQLPFYAWDGSTWHPLVTGLLGTDANDFYNTFGMTELVEWSNGELLLTGCVAVGNTEPDSVYSLAAKAK